MTTTQQTLPACSKLRDEATRNEAFDRLVGVLLRPIYWHVRRLVVEHDEAEEITQETFVRAFEQFDRFRGGDGELRLGLPHCHQFVDQCFATAATVDLHVD